MLPQKERQCEHGERLHKRKCRVVVREEHVCDHNREVRVRSVIEPFDEVAKKGRYGYLFKRALCVRISFHGNPLRNERPRQKETQTAGV